jgi:alanine racemase
MTPYSPEEIAEVCGKHSTVNFPGAITRLLIDSRSVFDASESLFFALRGARHDGHQFLNDLFQKGVRNFVVEEGRIPGELKKQANWFETQSPLDALQDLAAVHRSRFRVPLLAITGSNGKTIVKEWLAQMIATDISLTRSPRSYNSQVGVPLSLWQMNEHTRLAIIEAGISKTGEMSRLAHCIKPTLGLFTTLGQAHQENFSSLRQKLDEKLLLFREVDTLFYCKDASLVHESMERSFPDKEKVTWGRSGEVNLLLVEQIRQNDHTRLLLRWNEQTFFLTIPFTDEVSVENVMHVTLFLLHQGYAVKTIADRVEGLLPVAMRLEQKSGIYNNLLINDSYNADITSLEVALDFLVQQSRKKGMPRTVILSDLLQTGIADQELYPMVAELMREKEIDRFIGIGPALSRHVGLFGSSARFFPSTEAFLSALSGFHFKEEAILVKGARPFSFEQITSRLELKKHVTVMEINLDALVHNLNEFRSRLKPTTKVLAMVKAFSYGSGSFEIASALQHQKVDYLGVAFADEGMELRKSGISLPIMVMNPDERSFGQMLEYNLEPEIYSFRVLNAFYRAAELEGIDGIPVHIKIDTGMNRMGFLTDETELLIERLKQMPLIRVKSVFSHLVGSENEVYDGFTQKQINQFKKVCSQLREGLGISFIQHILNSSGIERFPAARFDMVRLGIGLYGFGTGQLSDLRNVVTLKTFVSQIKPVKAYETIGYGRAGWLKRDGHIAVIPIGYADGLNRRLGNGVGTMMINGRLAKILGNICMDTCMVDVSDIQVVEGDEVIVFGDDYPLLNLAQQLDTIPYEILTGISRRVNRVYFKE